MQDVKYTGCRKHRLLLRRRVKLTRRVSWGTLGWGCRIHRLLLNKRVRHPRRLSCGTLDCGCRKHRLLLSRSIRFPRRVYCGTLDWGSKIHLLLLCRRVSPPPTSVRDMTQNNAEVSVMLELWEMRSTPSLPLLPGTLWPGVVARDRVLLMG